MDFVSIVSIVGNLISKIIGTKDEAQKQAYLLELQTKVGELQLAAKQIDTNIAEASNQNRKWPTWRELLGFVCVAAFTWEFVLKPILVFLIVTTGHPTPILPQLDVSQLMTILMTMLGAYGWQYVKDNKKK